MIATPQSSSWNCDRCDRVLNHGEFRFTCTVCENYDLCDGCTRTLNPPHRHRLMRELAYRLEEKSENYASTTMANNIQIAATMYRDRHCLGARDVDLVNPLLYTDTYSWLTYETVNNRVKNFGNGLRTLVEARSYLGICAKNQPEWVIVDFACIMQNIISVPIYCFFNDRELVYIINHTNQCPCLRHIICIESISDKILNMVNNDLSIHYMNDIETYGIDKQYPTVNIDPNECFTITYTSGSSGLPKGAIISESIYRIMFSKFCRPLSFDYINFCYEPLAWATGRDAVIRTFLCGGRTGFSTGDMSRFVEELALVRPTIFSATPAIWNKFYAEFMATLSLTTSYLSSEAAKAEEDRLLKPFQQDVN
ncbi:hypothetical protein I4U23_010178 [Adineta vaga]|nr:hypothetical protein I4U23_010178 [Adineta vaga]